MSTTHRTEFYDRTQANIREANAKYGAFDTAEVISALVATEEIGLAAAKAALTTELGLEDSSDLSYQELFDAVVRAKLMREKE